MMCLRGVNQKGTGVPERSIPMSPKINFCRTGVMSVCTEKDNGWKTQWKCFFSRRSSWEKRCMYCVHNGEFCDNPRAQYDAMHPVIVLKELQELLDADSEGQKKVEPNQDEYTKFLDKVTKRDKSQKSVLPDMTQVSKFLNKAKGGP